jgi:hypothetical protein
MQLEMQLTFDLPEFETALLTRTPHRPYCTADLERGVKIRSRQAALKLPYTQVNPPNLRFWMVHDIDRSGAAIAWEDADLPPPAWSAANRANGHAHLAWGLRAPVLTGDGGRDAPLRYLTTIEAAYRARLDADRGYAGVITKNPLHPLWRVLKGPNQYYELGELAEYIPDLNKFTYKGKNAVEEIGLGRNCTLFDRLRVWSYVAVRQHREVRNFVLWQKCVYDKAQEWNGDFKNPLDSREAAHISASVARWVWKKDADARAKFVAKQSYRGKLGGIKSGEVRRQGSVTEAAPWLCEGLSRTTWYRRQSGLIVPK